MPGPIGAATPRSWSGATGAHTKPVPFSVWGPLQLAHLPPGRAAQKLLQAKPKAAFPMIRDAHDDDSSAKVVESVLHGPPARARSSDPALAAHMRQASNVLKSIAVLIAPRPSTEEHPIIISTTRRFIDCILLRGATGFVTTPVGFNVDIIPMLG